MSKRLSSPVERKKDCQQELLIKYLAGSGSGSGLFSQRLCFVLFPPPPFRFRFRFRIFILER